MTKIPINIDSRTYMALLSRLTNDNYKDLDAETLKWILDSDKKFVQPIECFDDAIRQLLAIAYYEGL